MVTEEDISRIRKEIEVAYKKNPRVMFHAFCFVFADTVAKDFEEFMVGLEDGFTKKERLVILKGIMERKAHFWESSDLDGLYEMSSRILKEFNKLQKSRKRR